MSNKHIDMLEKKFHDEIIIERAISCDRVSYVVVSWRMLTGVGYMRCLPGEEFKIETGLYNAFRRALKHLYEQMRPLECLCCEREVVIVDEDHAKYIIYNRLRKAYSKKQEKMLDPTRENHPLMTIDDILKRLAEGMKNINV